MECSKSTGSPGHGAAILEDASLLPCSSDNLRHSLTKFYL